jgi:hypothetical protein
MDMVKTSVYLLKNLFQRVFVSRKDKKWSPDLLVFVFGSLLEYSGILLMLKLEKLKSSYTSLKGTTF